jgi:hypothetical protein
MIKDLALTTELTGMRSATPGPSITFRPSSPVVDRLDVATNPTPLRSSTRPPVKATSLSESIDWHTIVPYVRFWRAAQRAEPIGEATFTEGLCALANPLGWSEYVKNSTGSASATTLEIRP